MNQTSLEYFLITGVIFVMFYSFCKRKQIYLLLASNLAIYYLFLPSWFSLVFPLFLSLVVFLFAKVIYRKGNIYLAISVCFLIILLVFFKYSFFKELFNLANLGLFAPIGISYIVFQGIGYLIDVKNGSIEKSQNFVSVANYLLFFPKITAGPVERAYDFFSRFENQIIFNINNFKMGVLLISYGIFKKLTLATFLSGMIYNYKDYDYLEIQNGLIFFAAILVFPLFLYADFSSYTDIARGTGLIFGIDLRKNFLSPFFSTSVTDFWRRWHISLSSWFNEYFFTPLSYGLRRSGRFGLIFSLFATFVLLGIWHGSTWGFVMFGFLHGSYVAIEYLFYGRKGYVRNTGKYHSFAKIVLTYFLISISFVFFRTQSLNEAFYNLKLGLFDLTKFANIGNFREFKNTLNIFTNDFLITIVTTIVVVLIDYFDFEKIIQTKVFRLNVYLRWIIYYCIILGLYFAGSSHSAQFIYTQF